MKIEWRVRKIERFIVTRFEQDGNAAVSSTKGEYDNSDVAHEVAYALCRAEHERLGWKLGDGRIMYPIKPAEDTAEPT